MLKRNDFPFKFTYFYLCGILIFCTSAKTSSVRSTEFSSAKCCFDSTPQSNSSGFNKPKAVNDIHPTLEKPELSESDSKDRNHILIQLSRNATDGKVDVPGNDTVVSSGLVSDSFSKYSNFSNLEDPNQSVSAKDKSPYQYTESYSVLDFDSSNDSEYSLVDLLAGNSSSPIISTLSSHNTSKELQNSSTIVKNQDIFRGTSTKIGFSPENVRLSGSSKDENSGEYSSSQPQLSEIVSNSSMTRSSHHESSNYIYEIFLLNPSEQAQGRYISEEKTYGLKNYYQWETNNFENDTVEIKQNNSFKETTEYEEKAKESPDLNTSSIQFNLLSLNVSTLPTQNWFYNFSDDESSKNESFANDAIEIVPLNNQSENETDILETSSEVSVTEFSSINRSLYTILPKTLMSSINRKTDEDLSTNTESTTESGKKFNNCSLGAYLFNLANGTIVVTTSQENLTDISNTNCSINDSNNEFCRYKNCSLLLNSKVAGYSSDKFIFTEQTEASSRNLISSPLDMLIATSTSEYITLKNVTENISEDSDTENVFANHTLSTNSKLNVTSNLTLASEINNTRVDIKIPSTELYSESPTPALVYLFPSVLLATEYNHPASNNFAHSKKQHLFTIKFSNDSMQPQISENRNETSLSTNDFQLIANKSSTKGDSLFETSNDIWVKSSRNDKTLFQNFTDLNNNTVLSNDHSELYTQQSKDFLYGRWNKSRDSNLTATTDTASGKIFWKPLSNLILSSSQTPPVEEETTERRIIWNLCFTKKPGSLRVPKEILMTKGPGNTKVFWNLCPTKKPYLTTLSYDPTESSFYSSTTTVSSPLSLFDIPSNPSGPSSSITEAPTEAIPLEEDGTTTLITETTDVTYTEAAPEETTQFLEEEKEYLFPVYWNVPTFQCHKYGLNFSRVKDWGIQQNYQDEFRGEEIAILYDPGEFPALLPASGGRRVQRNGGVPQEGSLTRHLSLFQSHLEKLIPNVDFSGLAIIDFEHWRPVWRQNWGSLSPYRDFSKLIEKRRHPFWFSTMVEVEATYRYELGARVFLLDTLRLGKKLRPKAKWGYYGFPFCFNYTPHNNRASCSYEVQLDNDNMYWLFSETTAHYPSLYLKYNDMYSTKRQRFIKGRLDEALRVANGVPVYPYVWFKYHDSHQFLTKEDMVNLLKIPRDYGCKGAVVWGASRDVNSREKCLALQSYLEEVIGPAVKDLHEENFRVGSVDHEVDENYEEDFSEEGEDENLKEKKNSYNIREFEV